MSPPTRARTTTRPRGRFLVACLPWAWALLFFALPFALIVGVSLSTPELSVPPYVAPVSRAAEGGALRAAPDTASYRRLGEEVAALATRAAPGTPGAELQYLRAYGSSLLLAALTTLGCLLVGYPCAYHIARSREASRQTLLMLVMLPFWTSLLLRVYAWMGLLDAARSAWSISCCCAWASWTSRCSCSTTAARCWWAWSTATCRSWCCRGTPTWSSSTAARSRRRETSAPRRGGPSRRRWASAARRGGRSSSSPCR